jgi:hypothetical protein
MLVLIERSKPPFLPRLLAELGSSGFDVAVVTPSTFPPGRPEIEQLAQREGATVQLLVVEAGAGLEIWIVDPATGKTVFREVILGLYEPREAPELVAIRLVETFRATLLDFASPHTSAPPLPLRPVPPVDSSTHAGPSRFAIAVGGGGAYSAGGIGPTAHLDLALGYRMGRGFSIAVDGALTPARTKVRGAPEGEAEIAWYLAGVSFGFSPGDPAAPIRFRSSAGAWIGWMSLTGQPVPPYVNTPAEFVSVIPHLDAGLRLSLTPSVALAPGLSLGVSAPAASIRFAGREVATWGRPLWMGSLAVEAALDR